MSLKYRDLRMKCELFRLVDPTLAEDPMRHPDPEVVVVEDFRAKSFEEAATHVAEYSKAHPEHTWYFRPRHDRSDYGLWHKDGVCSFGFNDVDEWFTQRIVKYRIRLKELKKEYASPETQANELKRVHCCNNITHVLCRVGRLRKMSANKFWRGLVKAWVSTCDWCSWCLKDKWIEMWKDHRWKKEQLAYWKKNKHDITEWWSLELHLLKDLKWNLKRLIKDGYAMNTEFIKDVVTEEYGNEPGFDLDESMNKYFTGKGNPDLEERAVKRQNETYERICHLVDLYTFYYNQEIDDEDAFTSKKRTEDMKPILMPGTYDMLDYKAMIAKGDECWREIWELVKRYGQQMGD